MQYKFNEENLIAELKAYVDKTYDQHYATDKYQATDIIIDSGHGTGFCLGNVIKYAKRYGRKGDSAEARKDLMKIMHYALIQLWVHDQENGRGLDLRDVPNPIIDDGVDWTRAPTRNSLNDATPDEWDKATKSWATNPNGPLAKSEENRYAQPKPMGTGRSA